MFRHKLYYILFAFILAACSERVAVDILSDASPNIFPDYKDITIPPNIAPLNFRVTDNLQGIYTSFRCGNEIIEVKAKDGQIRISEKSWKRLLETAMGKSIEVLVSYVNESGKRVSMKPFYFLVANEPIDTYLTYRLIPPGYELWNRMGIYQRNLTNFSQTPVIENKSTDGNCMNCHSFRMQNAEQTVLHMRGKNAGTYIINKSAIEKINTKTDRTISALVYPFWHPSGRYIAFSVNDTKQGFHTMDKNRVEVYDNKSDVVVYDIGKHEIITSKYLFSDKVFENFPTFSPDGTKLYFCSSDSVNMPREFRKVRYSLCSIDFDAEKRMFGERVDTIYNARTQGKSASFPRISPDGKFLLYTLADYGGFHIWHKEADLYMINLKTMDNYPLSSANSNDTESYHSWSSNSRWIVFSSRRIDGLYTRPFFAHVDSVGNVSKAFVLPQKDCNFYDNLMVSYNVPEFSKNKVNISAYEISQKAKNSMGSNVRFITPD